MDCPNCGEFVERRAVGERVAFKHFRSYYSSWETLFQDAANFASELGKERVISISHSADSSDGVITVWYWE